MTSSLLVAAVSMATQQEWRQSMAGRWHVAGGRWQVRHAGSGTKGMYSIAAEGGGNVQHVGSERRKFAARQHCYQEASSGVFADQEEEPASATDAMRGSQCDHHM